jgi:CRISPR/Cas system-associated exonuclease Cas4 (RecB family)
MTLNETIAKYLKEREEQEKAKHEPSGKLSASSLGQPLQWQVLKALGIPQKPFDTYTLGVFERGRQVEDWLISVMKPKETQVEVNYRGVVGYVDAVDGMPHEIKSVKNSKFKRITAQNGADKSHILQATLYALALNSDEFAIDYVAADDFRTLTYIYQTETYKQDVDQIIDSFQDAIKRKVVPIFEAKESWQAKPDYNNYFDWIELTQDEAMTKLRKEHGEQFNKYQKGELKCQSSQ